MAPGGRVFVAAGGAVARGVSVGHAWVLQAVEHSVNALLHRFLLHFVPPPQVLVQVVHSVLSLQVLTVLPQV